MLGFVRRKRKTTFTLFGSCSAWLTTSDYCWQLLRD